MLQKEKFQKTAETSADLIGYKSADKITNVLWESTNELPSDEKEVDVKELLLRKDTYLQKKDNKFLMIWYWYNYIIMEYQKIENLLDSASN